MKSYLLNNNDILITNRKTPLSVILFELFYNKFDFKSCLDIGCGEARIFEFINKKTKSIEYLGIDIDAGIYKVNFENKNIHKIQNNNDYKKSLKKNYDVGIFFDILEHDPSFIEPLSLTKSNINEYILFSLPNDTKFLNRIKFLFTGKMPSLDLTEISSHYYHKHHWMINVDQCEKFLKKYLDNYNLIAKYHIFNYPMSFIKRNIYLILKSFIKKDTFCDGTFLIFRKTKS